MKWLAGVFLLLLPFSALAELEVKYAEPALFMTVVKGDRVGKVVCLKNKTEEKNGLPEGWHVVTCNSIDNAPQWILCYVNVEKRSFLCGVRPS